MKKLWQGAMGLVALGVAAPAFGADLPARTAAPSYKAPAMVAAAYDWSGLYMGINGGWGQNRDCRSDVTAGLAFGCHDGNGGTVGGQMGYRWQTGGWVFGLEGQGNWADLSGNSVSLVNPGLTPRSKMDGFGLFTGQIGYAWNTVLLYVKGGAAVTDTSFDVLSNATGLTVSSADHQNNWGSTVGTGFEVSFAPDWSAAVEYDHIFQSTRNLTFTTAAGVTLPDSFSAGGDTDLVTLRVNYRWGGPTIAKY